jgi:predicted phosphate transport protein (TIGR00153 family)
MTPRWHVPTPSRDRTLTLFDEAADNAADAAGHLATLLAAWPQQRSLAAEIKDLEHNGDRITHDLMYQVQRSFILPFDREDAHRLASAIDDVTDYVDEIAEHVVIYKVGAPPEQALALAQLLSSAARELAKETRFLHEPGQLGQGVRRIDEIEHDADQTVRSALSMLFTRETDPLVVLRWKDVLDRLENAVDSCNSAGRVLENIRIKTGR